MTIITCRLTPYRLLSCIAGLLAFATAAVADDAARPQASQTTAPNVLFISIDDLNDWVEPLGGHPNAKTPNIAELAAEGMTFTNAHASATVCNPSRVSFMTGKHPMTTGVLGNRHYPLRTVLPEAETLIDAFQRGGYFTAGFGKIFHRNDNKTEPWNEYSWSSGRPKPDELPNHGIPELTKNVYRFFDWGSVNEKTPDWGEYKSADGAIAILNRKHQKPFFLAVGFRLPHLPWYVPKRHMDAFPIDTIQYPATIENDLEDIPYGAYTDKLRDIPQGTYSEDDLQAQPLIDGNKRWREAIRAYLAATYLVDEQLGRIMDALHKSPHADNTIVVLFSDHGFHLGEKGVWRKNTLWEESTRVPLIFKVPGVTQAGSRSAQVVSLLDLYPTLTHLAGVDTKMKLDGLSLAPILENPQATLAREYVTTISRYGAHKALRSNRWRYIRYQSGEEELYDHDNDPHEWHNLVSSEAHQKTLKRLRTLLAEEFK